jgi:hypothetical protein
MGFSFFFNTIGSDFHVADKTSHVLLMETDLKMLFHCCIFVSKFNTF